jgi:hypothetical protein
MTASAKDLAQGTTMTPRQATTLHLEGTRKQMKMNSIAEDCTRRNGRSRNSTFMMTLMTIVPSAAQPLH